MRLISKRRVHRFRALCAVKYDHHSEQVVLSRQDRAKRIQVKIHC